MLGVVLVFVESFSIHALTVNESPSGLIGTPALLYGAMTALGMAFVLLWLWAIGSFLNSIAQPRLVQRTALWTFALIYPVLYLLLAAPFFITPGLKYFEIILPFHFLAFFCVIYDLRFVSKGLALAENGRSVTFYDYAGPFFLIWFLPIGIWLVQPRINRLYAERSGALGSAAATNI